MEGKIEKKSKRDVLTLANSSKQYEHLQLATASVSQLRQMQGPQSFYYVPTFGNVANPNPGIHSVSHSHSGMYNKGQAMLSCYKASPAKVTPVKKQLDSLDKPPTMTPQEKIEKLRRLQQMQAMLAIQKQQEQFGQQVCSFVAQESPQSQPRLVEDSEVDLDDTSPFPSVETCASIEQGDSSTVFGSIADSAAEEIVLRQLQDEISKVGVLYF